ncbi:MAG: RNA-binding transcriptional accessory protein [Hahellaceae bacterium]|nr:RNA-binding transcriptional accessory protein [Hahellaceae bacterium]MCP5210141.1 RNA-binding transcriptional accessory protein [Hahellaceae bacterium]
MNSIFQKLAEELSVHQSQIEATVALIDEGATVPFIARYRKEVTGSLDDTQLRTLEERLRYLRELEDRRATIINSVKEQDKLTPELEKALLSADTKNRLEDLYLPYKPKRRTKAQIAIEAGLEPLALSLLENTTLDPEAEALRYVSADKGVADVKAALEGAKFILMERFSEDADLLEKLRQFMWNEGQLVVKVVEGQEEAGAKFRDYFDYREPLKSVPSHRALAVLRGRNENVLSFTLGLEGDADLPRTALHPCESMVAAHFKIKQQNQPADKWLAEVVRWTWKVKLSSHIETELMGRIREQSEEEAIKVFASNLKDLLLAAPAGPRATLGLDPGIRTGVKVAAVDATGKVIDFTTIYPHAPKNQWKESIHTLAALCAKHKIELVSIGNGTASRETDKLVSDLMKAFPELKLTKLVVNEAGASVYSASEFAAREFPDLDVTIRGAVSIARRLQDPLAELVKIDPKSIGVGQYQHDVSQPQLARSLGAVVEDCVNAVGVDLNTASAPLLTKVSGLNSIIAENIVEFRNQHGKFSGRKDLLKVPRLGEKTFEQAAGFLRIMQGKNPLDASSVHPEAYSVVESIAAKYQRRVDTLIGDTSFLRSIKAEDHVSERFGLPTVKDILVELDKPGRDPRPEFKAATFQEGIEEMKDLKTGMILEGAVTNVTNFGAFVDIGVHQDGLVHISSLANRFVKDPREVVKAGDIVKVKVLEVDLPRKRIALTMRLDETPEPASPAPEKRNRSNKMTNAPDQGANSLAAAFAAAKEKQKSRV